MTTTSSVMLTTMKGSKKRESLVYGNLWIKKAAFFFGHFVTFTTDNF